MVIEKINPLQRRRSQYAPIFHILCNMVGRSKLQSGSTKASVTSLWNPKLLALAGG